MTPAQDHVRNHASTEQPRGHSQISPKNNVTHTEDWTLYSSLFNLSDKNEPMYNAEKSDHYDSSQIFAPTSTNLFNNTSNWNTYKPEFPTIQRSNSFSTPDSTHFSFSSQSGSTPDRRTRYSLTGTPSSYHNKSHHSRRRGTKSPMHGRYYRRQPAARDDQLGRQFCPTHSTESSGGAIKTNERPYHLKSVDHKREIVIPHRIRNDSNVSKKQKSHSIGESLSHTPGRSFYEEQHILNELDNLEEEICVIRLNALSLSPRHMACKLEGCPAPEPSRASSSPGDISEEDIENDLDEYSNKRYPVLSLHQWNNLLNDPPSSLVGPNPLVKDSSQISFREQNIDGTMNYNLGASMNVDMCNAMDSNNSNCVSRCIPDSKIQAKFNSSSRSAFSRPRQNVNL